MISSTSSSKVRSRFHTVFSSVLWCLFFFLLICVVFSGRLQLPTAFKVLGRLHPLVIHFPLVLSILISCLFLVTRWRHNLLQEQSQESLYYLLGLNAFFGIISALFGIFLSREGGYDAQSLLWHKWSGIFLACFSYVFFLGFRQVLQVRPAFFASVWLFPILAILVGHAGGNITHGSEYIFEPMEKLKQRGPVDLAKANVYEAAIQPIFDEKCISCHSEQKTKGGLLMSTLSGFEKGGRHGVAFKLGDAENSLIWKYINLPEEDKKHMPPAGKPQLTDEDKKIILQWLKSGIDPRIKWASLSDTLALKKLVAQNTANASRKFYDFAAADPGTIKKLNNFFRVIKPTYEGSPALNASFYGREKFNAAQIAELRPIATQVVQVDLHNMPLKDEDLKEVLAFPNLEVLNLNYTNLTGASLVNLRSLKNLERLSLSGIKLAAHQLDSLGTLPALKEVYVWNTGLDSVQLSATLQRYPQIHWVRGFEAAKAETIALNPPILSANRIIFNDSAVISAYHPVRGVVLKYSLDEKDPDSAKSPVTQGKFVLNNSATLKVTAYGNGWLASTPSKITVYKSAYRADSIRWKQPPSDPRYAVLGAGILIDTIKSDEFDFNNRKWIGSQKELELYISFKEPVELSSVGFSSEVITGPYLFPPESIRIEGGLQEKGLHLLSASRPAQPKKDKTDFLFLTEKFAKQKVRFLKINISPVAKLPAWHAGKGKPAWVFIDEILFN